MKQITVHTDGACSGNPGPGGWAAVLMFGPHRKELCGGVAATTNNRMELQAAIEALAILKEPCQIQLFTDSQYLRQGITSWLFSWKRNGWQTRQREPVKNEDLWRRLDACTQPHKIEWRWLKGHAGHKENERCDVLAVEQIGEIRRRHTPQQLKALLKEFSAGQKAPATGALFGG